MSADQIAGAPFIYFGVMGLAIIAGLMQATYAAWRHREFRGVAETVGGIIAMAMLVGLLPIVAIGAIVLGIRIATGGGL